jgi:hypothetical protein
MNAIQKLDNNEILKKAQTWFRDVLVENHIKNTAKLQNIKEFKINPFLIMYLANFLTGNSSAESIAKALIYPRVLGQSISTSFGSNIQKFTNDVLGSLGSVVNGIDIEFIDAVDGKKKYCQLKAGPNTINKDDVETIKQHFDGVRNLARTNNLDIGLNDLIVGVIYGENEQLSANYKNIERKHHFPVIVGQNFWHRLTGDKKFYFNLITAFTEVANEADASQLLEETIKELAQSEAIQKLASKI